MHLIGVVRAGHQSGDLQAAEYNIRQAIEADNGKTPRSIEDEAWGITSWRNCFTRIGRYEEANQVFSHSGAASILITSTRTMTWGRRTLKSHVWAMLS